ncbi:hypothetical protein BLX06_31495 [Bacillus cereus]|uniref:Uncharacterized protein n=1 Tax=Bacillus cereus TaxID=1396 RepID=A0A9X6B3A5_BACCE|nr:hypothetical protein BLX06_31495 [Bacillus cereus]
MKLVKFKKDTERWLSSYVFSLFIEVRKVYKFLHIHTKIYAFCARATYNITFVLQKRNISKKNPELWYKFYRLYTEKEKRKRCKK